MKISKKVLKKLTNLENVLSTGVKSNKELESSNSLEIPTKSNSKMNSRPKWKLKKNSLSLRKLSIVEMTLLVEPLTLISLRLLNNFS